MCAIAVWVIPWIACAAARADKPITIAFRADQQTARFGEAIRWTVWLEFPEDAPDDAELLALAGSFRAHTPALAVAAIPAALTLGERAQPVIAGGSIDHILIAPERRPTGLPRRVPIYAFSTLVVNTGAPLWYDIDATLVTATPMGYEFHRREDGRMKIGRPIRIISDIVNLPSCNEADLAPPYGQLDAMDIITYVQLFMAGAPIADLASPYGVIDTADLSRFMLLYSVGCYESAMQQ